MTTLPAEAYARDHAAVGLSTLHRPTYTVVQLRGEIDIITTAALRERLLDVLRHTTNLLILDLSRVSFCDASGLAVLIGTQRRARLLGLTLRLAAPRPHIAKLLHVTGLARSLTIHPTLSDALAHTQDENMAERN
ncbi:MAG: STAS domain-containing protein [Streptomycetales bacterium]